MAIKPDYEAGTVSITNGTTTLTGVNTFWVLAKIQKGDTFKVKNLDAIIEEVVSNTEITLKEAWTGGDLAASAYAIRYQPDGSRFAGAYVEIRDLLANGNLTAFASLVGALDLIPIFTGAGALTLIPKNELIQGIETNEKVDTLSERAAFDTEAKGFTVLVADVGDGRSAIYFKESSTSGDWSDPAYLTGPNGSFQSEGDWSAATTYEDGQVVFYQGSSWISLQDTNLNHAPPTLPTTSNAWWTILARAASGFTFRGDWLVGTAYVKDDVVVSQNSSWIALQANTGSAPPTLPTTSNANWKLIVLGSGTFKADYAAGTQYLYGDTVLFNNSTWIAKVPTIGNAPPALPTTSNTWWSLVAAKGTGDVNGPASSVANRLPVFVDATGKTIGDSGVYARTALQQNLIINPAMQISQENNVTASGAAGYYAADQWVNTLVSSGVISFGRVASRTPRGSKYRLRLSVITADASIAAGEVVCIVTNIEGLRLANIGWDGATGTQLVLRFGFRGPAGTYSVAYRNGASTRSFATNFTVTAGQANTDIEVIKVIPACNTGGVWDDINVVGGRLSVTVMSGSTFTTTPDAWQTGNFVAATGISNGLATVGNTFELFDAGLYPDPNNTGVAPEWVAPKFEDDLSACMRYWQQANVFFSGNVTSGSTYYGVGTAKVTPRIATVLSGAVAGGTAGFANAVGTVASPGNGLLYDARVATSTTAGVFQTEITVNARM